MTLFLFLIQMFGILFALRTARIFRERGVIAETRVTKTGTVMIAAHVFLPLWMQNAPVMHVCMSAFLIFSSLGFFLIWEHKKISEMKSRLPIFLDRWILNMRLGNSLSSARDAALRFEEEPFQNLLKPLFETRASACGRHPIVSLNLRRELDQIASQNHLALPRLENMRRHLQQAADFRRRSGHAISQVAIQAAVMIVLLAALGVFTVHKYGWTRCADLILTATFLSLAGIGVMMHLARKNRWKI